MLRLSLINNVKRERERERQRERLLLRFFPLNWYIMAVIDKDTF